MTIESVAARAQTGKASIYRRWPTKQELVVDSLGACCRAAAVRRRCPSSTTASPLGTRCRRLADGDRRGADQPGRRRDALDHGGGATRPGARPTGRERFHEPRTQAAMLALLRARGRARRGASGRGTALVADVLPAMIAHRVAGRCATPIQPRPGLRRRSMVRCRSCVTSWTASADARRSPMRRRPVGVGLAAVSTAQ